MGGGTEQKGERKKEFKDMDNSMLMGGGVGIERINGDRKIIIIIKKELMTWL